MLSRMAELASFIALAAVVICTPGQDTALTIRNALLGGRRSGLATALGVTFGQVCWTLAAAAGAVAVLRASQPAFTTLRVAGAAYLVYLGVQSLVAAVRRRQRHAPRARATSGSSLRQGLVSNLANPKMVVFFTSLLPQFGDSFASLLGFGLLSSLLTGLWLAAYGITVARARRVLERDRVRRAFDAATGVVLVALGLRVAAVQR
jgi:threonine/homoserine/homoserine lactone efflux protein